MPIRNQQVDSLRLLALIGICVVNIPVMGLTDAAFFQAPELWFDRVGTFLVAGLLQLKFYILFSFVFGWGVHIQMLSARSHGQDFKRRYFRRMAGLAVLGAAHAVFVFSGDILLPYAILGVIFWYFKDSSVAALIRLALWMVPLSLCCLLLFVLMLHAAGLTEPGVEGLSGNGFGGYYLATTWARLTDWPFSFIFIMFVQGPLALGAFATGLAAAKSDFFQHGSAGMLWLRQKMPMLLLVAIPSNLLYACGTSGMITESCEIVELLGFLSVPVAASALSAIYLYYFTLFSTRHKLPKILILAGRNSLSTYMLQGVIAGFVFGAYGFGLFNTVGQAVLIPLSLVVAGLSILCVGFFASVFGRGPVEPVLRWIST